MKFILIFLACFVFVSTAYAQNTPVYNKPLNHKVVKRSYDVQSPYVNTHDTAQMKTKSQKKSQDHATQQTTPQNNLEKRVWEKYESLVQTQDTELEPVAPSVQKPIPPKVDDVPRTATHAEPEEASSSVGGVGGLMQQYEQAKQERAKLRSLKVKRSMPLSDSQTR